MTSVWRWDVVTLRKPEKLDNGWLRVDAHIAKTGVQEYQDANGGKRVEYRDASQVFDPKALSSFAMVPITNDHPPSGMLDASNAKEYAVGSLGENVVRDGDHVRASMLIHDAQTIADVLSGKNQVSCGYMADVEEEPGKSSDGTPYTHKQMNIRGNHVAIVRQGRAGPSVRMRVDSQDAVMVGFEHTSPDSQQHGLDSQDLRVMKMRIDGVEVEISDAAGQLVEKERAAAAEALKASKTDVEKLTGDATKNAARADAAEADLVKAKKEIIELPALIKASMVARTALEADAKKIAPALKSDGLSDAELRKQAVLAARPDVKLDGQTDTYVAVRFDLLVEDAAKDASPGIFGRREVETVKHDVKTPDLKSEQSKLLEAYSKALAK
jgi:uncharacterized protein